MYYEYYEPQQYYDDPEPHYDVESAYYDPEPAYYDPDPTYDDPDPSVYEPEESYAYGAQYDDQPYEDDASGDFCEDYDDGIEADEELVHEGFPGEQILGTDFGHEEQSDNERCVLPHYPEYEVDDGPVHAAENVVWQPPFDPDTATEAEVDACAWRSHYARGPPPDVSPDDWYDDMEAWRVSIDASLQAEAGTYAHDVCAPDTVYTPEVEPMPPAHATWVADMLAHLHEAHGRGELPDNEYESKIEALQADELEEQGLLDDGWIWDEERGDYWHPERGWGADGADDDEPAAPQPPLPDTTYAAHFSVHVTPPYLADFDAAAIPALDSMSPNHQLVYLVAQPAATSPPHFTASARPKPCKLDPPRYCLPRSSYAPRERTHPIKHPSQRPYQRSLSARPTSRNRQRTRRRTRSCPDFKRDLPPHLATPLSAPPTQLKTADAASPPTPPVPPDISTASTAVIPDIGPVHPTAPPELPIAAVNVNRAPVPPDIPPSHSCSSLATQRRQNAMRRIFKKGRVTT
ncbi:hypothetical protein GGX14DRAFT_399849 [Mycena pura]|uniref:Uncharacterized protein n=1 Tax=Mycena pura TaxID=153505 RepID=A0AAD6V499_9AGAR|nr:hypothetical protein GGX14DRAFT_399849 [Mycena pura]